MALRSVVSLTGLRRLTDGSSPVGRSSAMSLRCFSDGSGRVLSEEERAKETVYIQKMEKERLEKKKKAEEKAKAEGEKSGKSKEDGTH